MVANVGSKWIDGKMVFFSKLTGTELLAFDPEAETVEIPSLKIGDTEISQAAAQANSTATTAEDLVTDFNSLLAKLRASGLMAE